MLQIGGNFDFAQEAVGGQSGRQLWAKHLERDLTTVLEIVRQVDDRHSSSTDLSLDPVGVA